MSESEEQGRVAYLFIPAYTYPPPFPSEQVPLDTLLFSG